MKAHSKNAINAYGLMLTELESWQTEGGLMHCQEVPTDEVIKMMTRTYEVSAENLTQFQAVKRSYDHLVNVLRDVCGRQTA